jgi:hypothetical protein
MNERIRKLAEQAETKEVGYYFFDREKFAELIIQECVDIITPYSWRLPGEEYPHPISVIKDRFGIKKNY